MGYENPYPEPRAPNGNYGIVSHDNMGTKINYRLIKRCDILVSKYPESFVQIEKKWLGTKLTFITVKGYETPYSK